MTEPAPAPRSKPRGAMLAVLALLVVLGVLVTALVTAPKASTPDATKLVQSFLDDLKNGKYEAADALLCSGLRTTQVLQSGFELEQSQNGGSLKAATVVASSSKRTFRFAWPPTESSVVVTYLLTFKVTPRLHAARVRDTSDGLRICAFE